MDLPSVLLLVCAVVLVPCLPIGIWLLVTGLLRAKAHMVRVLHVDPGKLLRESAWGSGVVNGVPARNCLRVSEFEGGWVVRIAKIFGVGKLWLPKSQASIGALEKGGLLRPRFRIIRCGHDHVRLTGNLAAFVAPSQPSQAEPAGG